MVNKTSSEKIQELWSDPREQPYSLRSVTNNDLKVPRQQKLKAQGFSYFAPKLYNMLPTTIRQIAEPELFKAKIKDFIWENFPPF